MAVLVDSDRQGVWARWMRDNTSSCSVNKPDLRTAVNAIDQWVDDNAASFNLAIPQPARANLTAKQKAWLLTYVIRRRFEVT